MSTRRILTLAAAALLALSIWAFISGSDIPREIVNLEAGAERSDESLYELIAHRVERGEGYYSAAAEQQDAVGYPTSPPTIRLPSTTWIYVIFGQMTPWVLRGLLTVVCVVGMLRFEKLSPTRAEWLASTLLLAGSIGIFAHPRAVLVSEAWAVCLILLSLLLHRPTRYGPSVALGLLAACFRELALPYLFVMGLCAWRRNRKESTAWFASAVAFGGIYATHWSAALEAAQGLDSATSPGWLWFGGWPHVVDTFGFSSFLRQFPYEASVIVLPLTVLGWVVVSGGLRNHVLAVSGAFMLIFLFAGRPDTAYWGRLYVPLLMPGLAFAPRAIHLLIRGERQPVSAVARD